MIITLYNIKIFYTKATIVQILLDTPKVQKTVIKLV